MSSHHDDTTAAESSPHREPRVDSSAWPVWLLGVAVASGIAIGCFAGDSAGGFDDDYMDDPPPPGGCATECPDFGGATNPPGGPCIDSSDCADGGVCSAQFDGEVQSFECQEACVPLMDDSQWCADDTSCCTAGAICSSRGFCIVPGETEGLDSGSDSTAGDSTAGDSGRSSDTGASRGGTTDGDTSSTGGSSG